MADYGLNPVLDNVAAACSIKLTDNDSDEGLLKLFI